MVPKAIPFRGGGLEEVEREDGLDLVLPLPFIFTCYFFLLVGIFLKVILFSGNDVSISHSNDLKVFSFLSEFEESQSQWNSFLRG